MSIMQSTRLPEIGDRIGSGIVKRKIGEGGMATVFQIWNEDLEVFRAVKIPLQTVESKIIERFKTEAKIAAKLSHPNIIQIYSLGDLYGIPFIEMEYIQGCCLRSILRPQGFPQQICIALAVMLIRALQYLHTQIITLADKEFRGLIHRDIKPENIMISDTGVVKLTDFGIARPLQESLFTKCGAVVGSYSYLAPEQESTNEQDIDCRADLYAFGVILYEMLTGRREDRFAFFRGELKALQSPNQSYNPLLIEIIKKCLKFNKEERYSTAAEIEQELSRIEMQIPLVNPESIACSYLKDLRNTHSDDQTPVSEKNSQEEKTNDFLPETGMPLKQPNQSTIPDRVIIQSLDTQPSKGKSFTPKPSHRSALDVLLDNFNDEKQEDQEKKLDSSQQDRAHKDETEQNSDDLQKRPQEGKTNVTFSDSESPKEQKEPSKPVIISNVTKASTKTFNFSKFNLNRLFQLVNTKSKKKMIVLYSILISTLFVGFGVVSILLLFRPSEEIQPEEVVDESNSPTIVIQNQEETKDRQSDTNKEQDIDQSTNTTIVKKSSESSVSLPEPEETKTAPTITDQPPDEPSITEEVVDSKTIQNSAEPETSEYIDTDELFSTMKKKFEYALDNKTQIEALRNAQKLINKFLEVTTPDDYRYNQAQEMDSIISGNYRNISDRNIMYQSAKSATTLFFIKLDQQTYKIAMDTWSNFIMYYEQNTVTRDNRYDEAQRKRITIKMEYNRLDSLFEQAEALTLQFKKNATQQNYNNAMDAWIRLRQAYNSNNNHQRVKQAVKELASIKDLFNAKKKQ